MTSLSVGGRALRAESSLAEIGLVHGDVLDTAGLVPAPLERAAGVYVVAVGGPSAGAFVRLAGTPVVVGRGSDANLRIEDPLAGRRHVELTLSPDGESVHVVDLGSSNGTLVDGQPLQWGDFEPGVFLECGSTVLAIERIAGEDLPDLPPVTGAARPFARRFREALAPLPEKMRAPRAGDDEESLYKPSWWRPLVPLASGAGMAVVTDHMEFLAIMAIAPVLMFYEQTKSRAAQKRRAARQRARSESDTAGFGARARQCSTLNAVAGALRRLRRESRRYTADCRPAASGSAARATTTSEP